MVTAPISNVSSVFETQNHGSGLSTYEANPLTTPCTSSAIAAVRTGRTWPSDAAA